MSGLREDQREAEVLVTLIVASLPPEPRWCHRWPASSHKICAGSVLSATSSSHRFCDETDISVTAKSTVGAGLPAMRPEQAPRIQGLGMVAIMDGR